METQEPQITLVESAQTAGNAHYRHQKDQSELVDLRKQFLLELQKHPQIVTLQQQIEIKEAEVALSERELQRSLTQLRETAIAEWTPDIPKTMLKGLVTVNELSSNVANWDKDKALQYVLAVDSKWLPTLVQPSKSGFKTLANALEIPEDIISFGTMSASINYDMLLSFATLDAEENSESIQVAPNPHENVSKSTRKSDDKPEIVIPF